jgi:hypothetical protein
VVSTRTSLTGSLAQLLQELGSVAPTHTAKGAADLEVPPVGRDIAADQPGQLVLFVGATHGSILVWTKLSDQRSDRRAPQPPHVHPSQFPSHSAPFTAVQEGPVARAEGPEAALLMPSGQRVAQAQGGLAERRQTVGVRDQPW